MDGGSLSSPTPGSDSKTTMDGGVNPWRASSPLHCFWSFARLLLHLCTVLKGIHGSKNTSHLAIQTIPHGALRQCRGGVTTAETPWASFTMGVWRHFFFRTTSSHHPLRGGTFLCNCTTKASLLLLFFSPPLNQHPLCFPAPLVFHKTVRPFAAHNFGKLPANPHFSAPLLFLPPFYC